MNYERPIGIAGAGSIGCFVGGMLAVGGHRVALLARPRVIGEIETHGLRLTASTGAWPQTSSHCLKIRKCFPTRPSCW